MANVEHLTVLKQGAHAWNAWPGIAGQEPDLTGARLAGAQLEDVDLAGAALDGADLAGANLRFADLSRASLQGAELAGCDLTGADLPAADLYGADLTGARLAGADLELAILAEARLPRADLREAVLEDADLRGTDLRGADLRGSRLILAQIGGARLHDADLAGALFGSTVLVDLDLSRVRGLDAARHREPSSLGADTLARTVAALGACPGTRPGSAGSSTAVEAFYRGAGVDPRLIEYYHSPPPAAPRRRPCILLHHPGDSSSAARLHDELQARGVTCWLAVTGRATATTRAARGAGLKIVLCASARVVASLEASGRAARLRARDPAHLRHDLLVVDLDGHLAATAGATADWLRRLVVADLSRELEAQVERIVASLGPS